MNLYEYTDLQGGFISKLHLHVEGMPSTLPAVAVRARPGAEIRLLMFYVASGAGKP